MNILTRTIWNSLNSLTGGILRGGPLVAGVEVSVLLSETHALTATAAGHSLETGAQVADHVILNPAEVTVVFAMSNVSGGGQFARNVLETFCRMLEKRQPLELVTEHRVYKNMVITGLEPKHEAPDRGALAVTLRLRQVNFVSPQPLGRSEADLAGDAKKTAAGKSNAGRQNPLKPESVPAAWDHYPAGPARS